MGSAHKFLSSEMCSKQPIAATICSLAPNGIASHTSGALSPAGTTLCGPANGKVIPALCTMKPTKPAIAMRPCLISAWRRKPIVASEPWPQKSLSARPIGSQKPITGFCAFASASRSVLPKPICGDAAFDTDCGVERPAAGAYATVVERMESIGLRMGKEG